MHISKKINLYLAGQLKNPLDEITKTENDHSINSPNNRMTESVLFSCFQNWFGSPESTIHKAKLSK